MQEKISLPFVFSNTKINNYSQVVTELKKLQRKNKKYTVPPVKSNFQNVLRKKTSDFNVFQVVDGFVHEKLKEKQSKREKEIKEKFIKDVTKYIKDLKIENEIVSLTTNKLIGNIKEFEETFKEGANDLYFTNTMFYDLFTFLANSKISVDFDQEIAYLGIEYFKYVERFLKENHTKYTVSLKTLPDKISMFVKLKFNREELHLDVFEDQYVFAEIYVYLRCGFTAPVYKLFDKHRSFFQSVDLDFKNHFTSWLVSKTRPPLPIRISKDEDQFKALLLSLMQGIVLESSPIISSVEDFLWLNLITIDLHGIDELKSKFEGYNSPKGLLLVYILTKQYDKAMVHLLQMDVSVYPTFFLMSELAKKSEKKKAFVDFVFLVASKFKETENKASLIASLVDSIDNYYEIVPQMIVKMKMFDLLGNSRGKSLYLDYKITQEVVKILKKGNDKKQLLHIHHAIEDPVLVIETLIDVFTEGILTNANVDEYVSILDELKRVKDSKQFEKLEVLKSFYLFSKTPDLVTLKKTSLFSLNFKLVEVKFVIEKILRMACEVIKRSHDHEMAKKLFKIVGDLELSNECIQFINRELILYI